MEVLKTDIPFQKTKQENLQVPQSFWEECAEHRFVFFWTVAFFTKSKSFSTAASAMATKVSSQIIPFVGMVTADRKRWELKIDPETPETWKLFDIICFYLILVFFFNMFLHLLFFLSFYMFFYYLLCFHIFCHFVMSLMDYPVVDDPALKID